VALSGSVTVNPVLSPAVTCGATTTTSVQFTWPAVAGATGYNTSYTVNGGAAVVGTGTSPFTVSPLAPGDVVVLTVTPTGAGCFAASTPTSCTAVACVPSTVVVPANVVVCNGGTVAATSFTSVPAGATYAWTNSNPAIGLAASGTGNIASFTATNLTGAPITATITVTPTIAPCTGTPNTYTITVNPLSTITLSSGSSTPTVCSGTAITPIVYTIGGGATGASLSGTLPAGVTGTFAGTTFTISGTPSTAVGSPFSYTVTTTGSSCTEVSLSGTITVNALPVIGGPSAVCVGSTITVTGTPTAAAVTPWSSATTSVATINSAGLVTGISAGSSLITYTNSNNCTTTATITVNSLSVISGTLNVCVGNTTPLAATGTPSASPWTSATTSVATINSTTGVVTGVSAGTSVISFTNSNGCITTATVTVNGLPTISGTPTVCSGGSTTTLTGSGTPNAVNPWVSSATSVATISNSGVVTGVSAGSTTITYTNSNGCTATQVVTVNALPAATISYTPGTYCTSNSTPQLVTQSGTTGGIYSAPAGLSINSGSGSIIPSSSTPNSYTVTYTLTATGCPTQHATATVAIDPTPTLVIQNPNAVCQGNAVNITASYIAKDHSNWPAGTITDYYYDAAATNQIVPPASPANLMPSATTTYYIVARLAGCNSPTEGVIVTIRDTPSAPITADTLRYCQFADAPALTATGTAGSNLVWYTQPVGGTDSTLTAPTPPTDKGGVTIPYYVGQETTYGTGINALTCVSPSRAELDVKITTKPTATAKPNVFEGVAAGKEITFEGFATGGPISWTLNDSTIAPYSTAATQTLVPPYSTAPAPAPQAITTIYYLVVKSDLAGCQAVAPVIVTTVQPLKIPNIFSPNSDGHNDKWDIGNVSEFPDLEVSIFNRYGQFVFQSPDHYNTQWDGTYHGQPLPVGTYFYIIKTSGDAKPISGSVSIIR